MVVRPSGTEPKLKCYHEVREEISAGESMTAAERRGRLVLDGLIEAHQSDLVKVLT